MTEKEGVAFRSKVYILGLLSEVSGVNTVWIGCTLNCLTFDCNLLLDSSSRDEEVIERDVLVLGRCPRAVAAAEER